MQISWWTLLLQSVNFLVLVWLLQRFLYRPVQEIIAKRRHMQSEAIAEAEAARQAAEQQKSDYETALSDINAERRKVLDKARAEIEAERAKLIDDAKRAAADETAKARNDIERDKVAALADLREDVACLSVRLASVILIDISKSIPNEVILENLVTELSSLSPAELQRLKDEIAENENVVEIVTARKVEDIERPGWQKRLETAVGPPMRLGFKEDPSLISGAMLRLPHMNVDASWANRLEQSRNKILKVGTDGTS